MRDYTSTEPVFSESISIVEEDDLVNAENNNAAAKQLLQNILALNETKVDKEEGKGLVSDTERTEWKGMYEQATGYTDQKIAALINGAPSTLDTLGEIAAAMGENGDVVQALEDAIGTKANQAEMESLLGTKLEKTGDTKDNIVTFASSDTTTPSGWTEVATLQSSETHKSFLQKISTMFKNVRYIWKLIGTSDISGIGDGTLTGAVNELNTGIGCIEVYKNGLSVALGSNVTYVNNDFETNNNETGLLKPVTSGIQVLKSGFYIVISRFVITTTSAGTRVNYGIRNFKSATDYIDSIDSESSASNRSDKYCYIRAGHFDANTYLRPIASAPNGGTCHGCNLTVISLKAG